MRPLTLPSVSHSVLDKTSHQSFLQDLDLALGGKAISRHVSHKKWADTYHTLRRSPVAETAISFHSEYLKDLPKHCHAIWPHSTSELIVSAERAAIDGHVLGFPVPSLVNLCNSHPHIKPVVVTKSALALLAISRTNHSHAFFVSLEAARSRFPFVPDQEDPADAIDVAGPTFNGVMNLVAFQPEETVLDFLNRMQQDQNNLTSYVNVPWHEVLPRIGCREDTISRAADSLIFNWMPGLAALAEGGSFRNMKMTQLHIRAKLGMLANAGLSADGKEMVILLQGAVANQSSLWIQRIGEEWKRIILWLSAETSWNSPVNGFVKAMW